MPNLELLGVHSHIGSQIFEVEGFRMAVDKVAGFAVEVREELNIRSRSSTLAAASASAMWKATRRFRSRNTCKAITDAIKSNFTAASYPLPEIWIEPGRSMVGDAGTTLYTVGTNKDIPGVRKYIAVDGGMTDNPRPALYESKYEAVLANRANEAPKKRFPLRANAARAAIC